MGGRSLPREVEITHIKASKKINTHKKASENKGPRMQENTNRFLRNNGQALSQVS